MSIKVSTNASWNVNSVPLFFRIVLSLKLLLQDHKFLLKMIEMEISMKIISLLIQYELYCIIKANLVKTPQQMNSLLPLVG